MCQIFIVLEYHSHIKLAHQVFGMHSLPGLPLIMSNSETKAFQNVDQLFVRVLIIKGSRMILGFLTFLFVAAYISCPRSRSVCDMCSSLSFKSNFIIRFNLFGEINFSGSKSLG